MYAHLNNGGRVLDVADLRQYIYEQIARIRTNAFVMDGLYGNDNGHGQDISKGNGQSQWGSASRGKALARATAELRRAIYEMSCKLSANDPAIAMIAAGKRNQADQESTDEFSGRGLSAAPFFFRPVQKTDMREPC